MPHATAAPHCRPVAHLHQQLAQAPRLPFALLLDAEQVQQALQAEKVSFRERLFSPLVTLWVFLSQILDPDHSCRAAVARFVAWRTAKQLPACSADTSAYCKARQRLPEGVLARLTRSTGRQVHEQAPTAWRFHGRPVKIVDGTTASMPDTPANQQEYPQSRSQKPGLGFPVLRLVVLFALAVGTVLDAALGRCQGKQTGETSLFHTLHDNLQPDDLVLADRYYGSWWELALVRRRGADLISRLNSRRRADFRCGQRLGPNDHVVHWPKPPRPDWLDEATYAALPATLAVREVRVRVLARGFRTRVLVVVTTVTDPNQLSAEDIALLYRVRWLAELDLRSLKQTLQMDVLRCQTPEMVRKEVWAHLLGYNLIRGQMAAAAQQAGLVPFQLSFAGALQTVNAFAVLLWTVAVELLEEVRGRLRVLIASHRVGQRRRRSEPRKRKRRPKAYPLLTETREQAQDRLNR
jgi:Transposase DDE domain